MSNHFLSIPNSTSLCRTSIIINCLIDDWGKYNENEKILILQFLAKHKSNLELHTLEMLISTLIEAIDSFKTLHCLVSLGPEVVAKVENNKLLKVLSRFQYTPLLLYLDVENDQTIAWVENNIFKCDLEKEMSIKMTRFVVAVVLKVLQKRNILFLYNALNHSILGPIIVETIPEACLKFLNSSDLPKSMQSIFKDKLLKSNNSITSYSKFILDSKSIPSVEYLVGVLDDNCESQSNLDISSLVNVASKLSTKHKDLMYVSLAQQRITLFLKNNKNLKIGKDQYDSIKKIWKSDMFLTIQTILHCEVNLAQNLITELLTSRVAIPINAFLDALSHFKNKKADLKNEFLCYAIQHSKEVGSVGKKWCRVVLFVYLTFLSDPYFQLFLIPTTKAEIANIARSVEDLRSSIILKF